MICTYWRWLISSTLDNGTPPGRLLRRHLGRCAACRDFREQCLALAAALRDEPVPFAARPPIRAGAPPARRRFVAASLAAAALVIAALLVLHGRQPVADLTPSPSRNTQVAAVRIPSPDELVSAFRGSVADIADPVSRPVIREIEDLHAQYRHARQTLLAYLPPDPNQPPDPSKDKL